MMASIGDISFSQSQGYQSYIQNYPPSSPGLGGKELNQAGSTHPSDPVRLSLSPEAETMIKHSGQGEKPGMPHGKKESAGLGDRNNESKNAEETKEKGVSSEQKLTEGERRMVTELQQRDQEVRTHEAAHAAAAGSYAVGGPNYEYQTGPDGKSYAVGGNVKLDMSPESTAQATIAKMQTIRRAALAPADPSGQDRSVAAAATKMEMEARRQVNEEFTQKIKESAGQKDGPSQVSKGKISVSGGTYGMSNALKPNGQILNGVA